MSDRDPVRMVEDETEGDSLRVDLQRASAHEVEYDVAAGAVAFEASLVGAPPPGLEASVPGGAAGGGVAAGKLALVVFGVVAAVGIGVALISTEPTAAQQPQREAAAQPLDVRPAVVPDPPRSAVAVPALEAEPEAEREAEPEAKPEVATDSGHRPARPKPKPKPVAKTKAPKPPPAVDRLRAEMEATDRARKALSSDPAKALKLAHQADRSFSDGLFAEQRAGIATLALFAMGSEKATTAGERYLRKHPRGTYADKVRARLSEKP